jgi:hypothetical protein
MTDDVVQVYRVKGFTGEITTCQICGRDELRGTVILRELDAEGNELVETYAGTGCAAEVGRWTQRQVKAELRAIREAERAATAAARQAEQERDGAAFVAWVNQTYGTAATTRSGAFDAVPHVRPFQLRKQYDKARKQQEETTMGRNWLDMGAGDFHTTGTQLDMLAGLEGDGYGTIALDEIETARETPAAPAERADGALFGLALADATDGDDALFSVVAA